MQRTLLVIAGILFALVAATYITRFVMEMEVVINGWALPIWASLPTALVLILLAYLFFRAAGK